MRREGVGSLGLPLLASTLALAVPARAQVPAGPEFLVNTYTTDGQTDPTVAWDGSGKFVVAWQSQGQDGIGAGVFAQRFDAAGARLGGEFMVNDVTYLHQWFPEAAADARGNFVVAWRHTAPYPGNVTHARRFDASGQPLAPSFRVDTWTSINAYGPLDVAAGARGEFVVVWPGYDGSGPGIFGQAFHPDGQPRGAQFQANSFATGRQRGPAVTADAAGNFVVTWESARQGGAEYDIFGQRFDAGGAPRGGEFRASTYAGPLFQVEADVAADPAGNFVVTWRNTAYGVRVRRYDASGAPLGGEAAAGPSGSGTPVVAADAGGNFVVAWIGGDGSDTGIWARRFAADGGARGAEFRVNAHTTNRQYAPALASDAVGNFVVAWTSRQQEGPYGAGIFAQRFGGLLPAGLRLDTAVNGILEPGEAVDVRPAWRNVNGASLALGGVAAGFAGPPAGGVAYYLNDGAADYGTVASGSTGECVDCYNVGIGFSGTRPAVHWDATLTERITPDALGQVKAWPLHVGESFADVPRSSGFYRFVETLLHREVTAGCAASTYCPASATTRGQMAVLVLTAKEGAGYAPPACSTPVFGDVPPSSPFCRWVEELARRGVVSGCGGGNYCPGDAVTREQMAVFVLRTLDPALDPAACTTPMFADVPASSPFCRWIEELARRGVVAGCGGGNYCPASEVTREQMAVFIAATFTLTLYGQ